MVKELFGYHSTVIHRPDLMISDVYALARHFRTLLDKYSGITAMLIEIDQLQYPKVNVITDFIDRKTYK